MTNEQTYKTAEERIEAFKMFCGSQSSCADCPAYDNTSGCKFRWLALEAEDEKLENCPFCGAKCEVIGAINHRVRCDACNYESTMDSDKEKVIAAHNRVCRAVKAYKESEVKEW